MLLPGPREGAAKPSARSQKLDFNRDVRKVLSDKCFKCHGPDPKTQKAGLRLDSFEAATKPAKSGARPIVPGKPGKSELVRRVFLDDPDEMMPPPENKNPLTEEQRLVLKRWVEEGGEYKTHWSFVAPVRVEPPRRGKPGWARNAVDRFVVAKMGDEKLAPSEEADRYTLARRVYLDLIGLPPTTAEVDAFVNDAAPDAYERLVDRLLDSPAYGERWARPWLDLARYADTNGYEKDRPRVMWPYRDWVVGALNADLPFDRFTVEQVAGDMLPSPTPDSIIATGFHRNTMVNEEGGIDPMEFRFYSLVDRVATTGTVWLGLTVGCSQCHSHKYDPLMQREFYGMMAFFDQADETKVEVVSAPVAAGRAAVERRAAESLATLADRFPVPSLLEEAILATSQDVTTSRRHLDFKFNEWLASATASAVRWTVLRPTKMHTALARMEVLPDGSVLASGDQSKLDVYELSYEGPRLERITALRLEALPHPTLPEGGPGRVYYEGPLGDFYLSDMRVTADGAPVKFDAATESYASLKGFASAMALTAAGVVDEKTETGWSIQGGQGREHRAVFKVAGAVESPKALDVRMTFERWYAAALGRFRLSATSDAAASPSADLPAEVEEILLIPVDQRTQWQRGRLWRHFLATAPELAADRKKVEAIRKQAPTNPTSLAMRQREPGRFRETKLHTRGEFLKPAEVVEAGVPDVLHELPRGAPATRLDFARWLVDEKNPLVARVTVNRHWAAFFGRGIVRTLEDFGVQGESPTHPELLDWLATEFVRTGWSVKRLHRLIVTSATYRQSSAASPELLRVDPENRLLARGPRFRMEAELIRDGVLRASGLLTWKMGGESVYPPQPAGITEGTYGGMKWAASKGEDRYRRGLYTFQKRTAPYAMFSLFGAPSGEQCEARRVRSNTPLQALTMLNDAVFVEAARALGRTVAGDSGDTDEQCATAVFRGVMVRPPGVSELADLVTFYRAQLGRFRAEPSLATQLAGREGATAEEAAWTATARVVLNLDEAITKE